MASRRRQPTLTNFFASPHSGAVKDGIRPDFVSASNRKRQRTAGEEKSAPPSRFGKCPVCGVRFPLHVLLPHAEKCNGESQLQEEENADDMVGLKRTAELATTDESQAQRVAPVQKDLPKKSSGEQCENDQKPPWWLKRTQKNDRHSVSPASEPLPGLFLFEDFITEDEEEQILAELDGTCAEHRGDFLPWKRSRFNGKHKGKRWGVHCNLRDRRVDAPENPLPNFIRNLLLQRLEKLKPMMGCVPNEANAIDYRRKEGDFLQSHVDDRQLSKEPIANLSIAGDCIMTFGNEKLLRSRGVTETKKVMLKRRTLQILTGKARYDYSHGIENQDLLSDRRVSVTMRESPLTKKST